MAKSANSEVTELRDERNALRSRVDALERIVARVEPDAVLSKLPAPVENYSDDIPGRMLALAAVGLATAELRAELGITVEQQREWNQKYPEFAIALQRSRDLARAYWQRLSRQALEAKDWKFPFSQTTRFVETMLREEESEIDRGDASQLVHFNAQKGRDAIEVKQRKNLGKAN